MMMQLGEPAFCVTINPSDVNSPLVMNYGGHDINLSSTCHEQMPDYVTTLRTVADDPVASATYFHETTEAVFDRVLTVGASDGDGGALGEVQAYIGMTEEQGHSARTSPGFGCMDLAAAISSGKTLAQSLEKHAALAKHVGRII